MALIESRRTRGIIVGAPRSGTTSLWRQLVQHPQIAASRVKELNYFHDPSLAATDYDSHFVSGGLVTLEASPVYFREHVANAIRLRENMPDARLIFILREPGARLLAGYRSARDWDGNVARDVDFRTFAKIISEDLDPTPVFPEDPIRAAYAVDAKKVGLYSEILGHYLAYFAPEQMLVLFLDEMQANPAGVHEKCCRHLKIDPHEMPEIRSSVENQGVEIHNHTLFKIARRVNARLEPLFNRAPWVKSIARKLHHWLNAKPVDRGAQDVREGLEMARGWYAPANAALLELLKTHFPDAYRPDWIQQRDET